MVMSSDGSAVPTKPDKRRSVIAVTILRGKVREFSPALLRTIQALLKYETLAGRHNCDPGDAC